jgi:hypothetical protein
MTRSIGLVLDAMPSSSSWRLGDDLGLKMGGTPKPNGFADHYPY